MNIKTTEGLKAAGIVYADDEAIRGFFDQFRFLSNFHVSPCHYNDHCYMSTEHAYMAQKATNREDMVYIATSPNPIEARRRGKTIKLREDWDDIRLDVMYKANLSKYKDPIMRRRLQQTGNRYLEETNWWNDKFWGVCNGQGQNNLGKIIMRVRYEMGLSDKIVQLRPDWKI